MSEFNKEALLGEIKTLIAESKSGVVSEKMLNEKIDAINTQLKTLNEKDDNHKEVAELKSSVDSLIAKMNEYADATKENSLAIKGMTEKTVAESEKPKTFRDVMKAAIMEKKDLVLTKKNDDFGERYSLKEWFTEKGNQTTPSFTLKDAVDMLESSIVQNYVSTIRLTELDPNRVGTPLTIYPHVIGSIPQKGIKKPNMALLVVYSYEDGSGTKTEGSASSKSSFLFKTVSFPAFYIATYFTLSDETLDDLDEAMDEIGMVAPDKILDKIDTKILATTGDDSSDIAGLFTANKMTAFDPASYVDYAENATIVDLARAMKLNCETNKYRPDHIWMNPLDVDKIAALKNAIEDSVMDRRVVFNSLGDPVSVSGMIIHKSTAITANTMAVLDSKQLMMGIRRDMTMEIGYNGTDLTEGQKTVVIKIRVAFGVRDKAAVIYCDDIASDVTSINKAGA